MKLTKTVVGNQQTICLCKLATDPKFVIEVGMQLSPDVWEDQWAAILYGYIESYVRKYNDSVLPVLKRIAKERASSIREDDTAEATVRFAGRLQSYYEEHKELFNNDKYIRDSILAWIKGRNLTVLNQKLTQAVEDGRYEQAEDALRKYSEVKQVEFTAVDMMADTNKIIGAYEEERGELLTLSGDFGRMLGPLSRGDIMFVLGESGTGKSFVCLQIGYMAQQNGLSVLYMNLENTESQMIRRIYSNMSGCPREEKEVTLPYFTPAACDYKDDDDEGEVTSWKIAYKKKKLTPPSMEKDDVDKFLRNRVMESNGGRFLLESYAPKTLTVKALENELDNLRDYKNFIPDVLIVDYGDLMHPESSREDKRIQIDNIYLGLRSIALDRNILVISPIQSNRAGYDKDVKKSNVAENIGNVNHASVIIGLNHTAEEKEKGIMRINILKRRDGKECSEQVVCLGCMDIGRPIMYSRFSSKVEQDMKKKGGVLEDDDE